MLRTCFTLREAQSQDEAYTIAFDSLFALAWGKLWVRGAIILNIEYVIRKIATGIGRVVFCVSRTGHGGVNGALPACRLHKGFKTAQCQCHA